MKIILLESLKKLGKEGDEAEVKDGYARNYLIPQGLALAASDSSLKRLAEIRQARAKVEEAQKQKFLKLKDEIEKISLTITAEAKDDEGLYGTINEAQILKLLKGEGIEVERDSLQIDSPIDRIGVYNIKVSIHPQVDANLRVWVVKK